MKEFGGLLLLFGIGSFVLPLVGLQFKIFRLFGDKSTVVGVVVAVVGGALLAFGMKEESSAEKKAEARAQRRAEKKGQE